MVTDANPTWMGYSTGRWEGDTLVVHTRGFNGKSWLDQLGRPSTDALHVIERLPIEKLGLHLEGTAASASGFHLWIVELKPSTL
jgi:hypothetical protein